MVAGQGSVAAEVVADAPEVDSVAVAVGGGGLAAGTALAALATAFYDEARLGEGQEPGEPEAPLPWLAALRRINQAGATLLLVEQNVFQALAVADFAYVLGHGEMIAEGAAWELRGNALIKRVYLGEAIAG